MKWPYRHLYRNEKGFTLVELMIVIIILAILTGIAIPNYMALRNRARVAAAKVELMNIATALGIFEADWEGYPAGDFAAMKKELEGDGAKNKGDVATVCMKPVPDKDVWGQLYTYKPQGTGLASTLYPEYTIYSFGPNMTDGSGAATSDDIVVINGQLQ